MSPNFQQIPPVSIFNVKITAWKSDGKVRDTQWGVSVVSPVQPSPNLSMICEHHLRGLNPVSHRLTLSPGNHIIQPNPTLDSLHFHCSAGASGAGRTPCPGAGGPSRCPSPLQEPCCTPPPPRPGGFGFGTTPSDVKHGTDPPPHLLPKGAHTANRAESRNQKNTKRVGLLRKQLQCIPVMTKI